MKKLLFIIIALLIAVSSVALGRVLTEGHQHEMTKVDEIAATCTAQGTEAHYFCSGCGKYFEDAMGETEIKAPEVIEALGHNYSDWAAAEDTDNHKKTCSSCGDEQIKAHNWVEMDRVNPTHTSDGKASYTCSACSATKEETLDKTTDHSYGAWEKADADNHKKTCECGDVHTEAHTWTETGRVDATHTAEGKVTYTCNVCSETKEETLDKTTEHSYGAWENADEDNHKKTCECGDTVTAPHAWNDGVVTTPATHTTEGVKTYNCTDCGATKTETVDKTTDHSYGAWEKTDADNHKKTCECGDVHTEAHTWTETGRVDATHTAEGKVTYTCNVCSETKEETLDKTTEHSYGAWENADADNHKKTCECSYTITAPHAWNDGVVTTPATHTTEGVKTYTCTDCHATKTESIGTTTEHSYGAWEKVDADSHKKTCECGDEVILPHAWDEGEVTTPATHTTEGVKTFTCTDCGATKTESIGTTTDHSYGAWENVDADTHKQTCECGDEVILPHAWNEGEVTTPATHTTTGVKTFTCTDCGATKTEEVPVLANHTYNQKNTAEDYLKSAATCTSSAVYYYSCICGAISDTETFTDGDPIAHNFNQENTKLEGALKSAADCENAAVYYKSCSCGAISDTETFEDGYALGHNYGEVDYAWSDDNSICTATRVCANDAGHVETETVNAVGNEVAAPTCEEDGKTVYTATFENEAFADQTKEVTIGALGHDYESAVTAPTCTVEGLRTYTCKNNSEHTYTEEIAIDPTAHTNVNPKDDNCDSCGENLAYTFLVKDNNNNPFAAENGGSAIDNSENLTADKNRLNKASDAYEKTYGSTFTFRVFVEEATTVEFYLFESNKNGATIASTAITKLTVNGNAVTVLDTAIPKTTDWAESTAQYIHIATLNLQKGENVITFVRNGTDFSSTNDINIRGIKLVSNIEVKLDKVNVYEFSIANGNNPFISENGGSYNDDKDEANNPSSGTGGRYGNGGGAELTVTLWVEEDTVVTFRLISAWRDGRYFSYYKNLRSEGADSNNYYNPNISYLKVNGETVGVTPSAVSYSSQGFSTYAHCELATIELKAGVANVISFKINDTKGRGGTGDNVNFKGISIVSDVEVKIGADSE